MKYEIIPTREELEKHAKTVPEINAPEVIAMLRVLKASAEIRHAIIDVLEKNYHLSEGKLCVMIVLHQHPEGAAPSMLACKAGVSRATISAMLRRMSRDGLAMAVSDDDDGRGKKVILTAEGRRFMDEILPGHYLRITELMGKLTEDEQNELISLLKKIGTEES